MAYRPQLASALSGTSVNQLAYWRQHRDEKPPVLVPEVSADRPILYSFRDVMALRALAFLRGQQSLQRIRQALGNLRNMGEVEHLSSYSLVSTGNSIVLRRNEDAVDLVRQPGQMVLAPLVDIIAPFTNQAGKDVPHLLHPRPNLDVNIDILSGYPVVAGTRVPYDDVAALVADGLPVQRVSDYFPAVTTEGALDASEFARYVQSVA